jgi:ECF sigma factor
MISQLATTDRLFTMSEMTRILSAIERGDPRAAEELLPMDYDELRRLAAQRLSQEAPGQTLQATAWWRRARRRPGSHRDVDVQVWDATPPPKDQPKR